MVVVVGTVNCKLLGIVSSNNFVEEKVENLKKFKIVVEAIIVGDAASLRSGKPMSFLDSPPSPSSLFFPKTLPLISAFLTFALA